MCLCVCWRLCDYVGKSESLDKQPLSFFLRPLVPSGSAHLVAVQQWHHVPSCSNIRTNCKCGKTHVACNVAENTHSYLFHRCGAPSGPWSCCKLLTFTFCSFLPEWICLSPFHFLSLSIALEEVRDIWHLLVHSALMVAKWQHPSSFLYLPHPLLREVTQI